MKNLILLSFFLALFLSGCDKEENTFLENRSQSMERDHFFGVKTLDNPELKTAAQTSKKWETGQTIKIKFLNGSITQQNYVKQVAAEWVNYANLKFDYITSGNADVKIAFDWKGDYVTWSYVGTECQFIPQTLPSANFGFLDEGVLDYDDTKAMVLQTFGRILGLVYEHQNPTSTIKWKEPLLINYFRTMGWTERDINDFFVGLNKEESQYTVFDPQSIMIYYIPSRYTEDGIGVNLNVQLSKTDIDFIKTLYPKKKDYYNGYLHNLPEPNWDKLKTINGMIGTTRDKDGTFYFYPYNSGNIVKYDNTLTTQSVVARAIGNDFRLSPRLVPTPKGDMLVRKVYTGGGTFINGLQCVNLSTPATESSYATSINSTTYSSINYDYDREFLYHQRIIYNNQFVELGSFTPNNNNSFEGIIYWGDKYKWAINITGLNTNPTFYAYEQSEASSLYSESNMVMSVTIPNFQMNNGGYSMVYEYNNKLVVINFITSSILILDPVRKTYNTYTVRNAKWTDGGSTYNFCGGFFWKNKLMLYGQGYGKCYFEFPELMN